MSTTSNTPAPELVAILRGVTPARAERIRNFVPIERAERLSLYGEALPPGLTLGA